MIDLYYWPTPNGWKATIALEEMELPYRIVPINIGRGDQFEPDFLRISPNNRMPAIVDHEPLGGGEPLAMFESGAILLYLAEKSGRFLPEGVRERYDVTQWLMWQMGNLGPMLGQHGHFKLYAEALKSAATPAASAAAPARGPTTKPASTCSARRRPPASSLTSAPDHEADSQVGTRRPGARRRSGGS